MKLFKYGFINEFIISEEINVIIMNLLSSNIQLQGGSKLGNRVQSTVTIEKSDYPNGEFLLNDVLRPLVVNNPSATDGNAVTTVIAERRGGSSGRQVVSW